VPGPPEFRGFSDVDRTGRADAYASYLDDVRGLEAIGEWKERSFAALDPHPGAVLLDIGCGTGEDVRALARLVAPGGRAIGVDASEAMVAEAARRSAEAGEGAVEFRRADVQALDLPDGAVDGARAERVLQHVERPELAIAEMARVVRPGGAVVAAEPDWGTLVADVGDPAVADEIAAAAARRVRSALVGRTLRRRLLEAGLADVTVVARTLVITDGARAAMLFDLEGAAARAADDGRLTREAAAGWLADLAAADAAGRLLVAMTAFMAVGRVP
jgi:SAM-dependent methyltransferase